MDATDVRLLRAMVPRTIGGGSAHPDDLRPPALARAVGLSVNAVKARIARLEEEGVLRGHSCCPSLGALGLQGGGYLARAVEPRARDGVVRELSARGRLMRVHEYAGGHLCVEVAHEGERERDDLLEVIRHATGEAPQMWLEFHGEPPPRPLSPLDWRILAALRRDPVAPVAGVAEAVGVSARTVKRRLDRLVADASIWTLPRLDCARAAGVLLVELLFTLKPGMDAVGRSAILGAFEEERLWAFEPASHAVGHFDILAVARSTAHAEELRRRGDALAPVARVETLFYSGTDDHDAWVDRVVAQRGAAASPLLADAARSGAHP